MQEPNFDLLSHVACDMAGTFVTPREHPCLFTVRLNYETQMCDVTIYSGTSGEVVDCECLHASHVVDWLCDHKDY